MLDINNFGKYRVGLTKQEIKEWLKVRWNELLPLKSVPLKKINKATWKKFNEIAGCNTCGFVVANKNIVHLMYRWDVERFTNQLFDNKETYFD